MNGQGLWRKVYYVEAHMDPEGARKVKAALRAAMSDITAVRNLPEAAAKQAVWLELDASRTAIKNLIQVLPVDEELSVQDAEALFPRYPSPDTLKEGFLNAFMSLARTISFAKSINWDEISEELENDASTHLTLALILSGAIGSERDVSNL